MYDILTSSGEYNIAMHSFSIQDMDVCPYISTGYTIALFRPDFMTSPATRKRCLTGNATKDLKSNEGTEPTDGVAVVLPSLINKEWIFSEHYVGDNYDYTRESVYLVSGLQISKKKS